MKELIPRGNFVSQDAKPAVPDSKASARSLSPAPQGTVPSGPSEAQLGHFLLPAQPVRPLVVLASRSPATFFKCFCKQGRIRVLNRRVAGQLPK